MGSLLTFIFTQFTGEKMFVSPFCALDFFSHTETSIKCTGNGFVR